MKLSAKPISSPGRSDKFPPPLMRFLRSNVGSRSRGRSRTSPMFLRKAHKISTAVAESTLEPSSPKVTCMGQVRVGRSRKPNARKPGGRPADDDDDRPGSSSSRCAWISHSLLCHRPAGCRRWRMGSSRGGRGEPRCVSVTRAWRGCASFFHAAGRPRPKVREEDSRSSKVETEPKFLNESELRREEEDEEESEAGGVRVYVASSSSPCSPPKNALLLTRCRSAPYRSSSLACRFWGSPLNGAGESQKPQQSREESAVEEPKPLLFSDRESRVHPEEEEEVEDEEEEADAEEEERFLKKEIAGEITMNPAKIEVSEADEEGRRPSPAPPPRLTRCKSEPARTAAQKVGYR